MQGFEGGARIRRLVDTPARQAYYPLVTKDTNMETGRTAGEGSQLVEEPSASSEADVPPPSPDATARSEAHGLSISPNSRFLAAMRGEISLDAYVAEVAAHVEAQLPGARNQARST